MHTMIHFNSAIMKNKVMTFVHVPVPMCEVGKGGGERKRGEEEEKEEILKDRGKRGMRYM